MSFMVDFPLRNFCSFGLAEFVITEGIAEITIASTSAMLRGFLTMNAEK
jgi:hypothetical protein